MVEDLKALITRNGVAAIKAFPFTTTLHPEIDLTNGFDDQSLRATEGGTDLDRAIKELAELTTESSKPNELWIFTDGNQMLDFAFLKSAFVNTAISIFDYCSPTIKSYFGRIATDHGIIYRSNSNDDILRQ